MDWHKTSLFELEQEAREINDDLRLDFTKIATPLSEVQGFTSSLKILKSVNPRITCFFCNLISVRQRISG
jgi:hypothetical protein